jgi:FAD:protein FMN transferase
MRRHTSLAVLPGSVAGAAPLADELHSAAALGFGRTLRIAILHPDRHEAARIMALAFEQAHMVDRLLSVYNPSSQVFRLNRDGVLDQPDPHLLVVLAQARALSVISKGAFDMTVQALWRTCHDAAAQQGTPAERDRLIAKSKVGWDKVTVSSAQIALRKPGMQITLNGLAQGYAADLVLASLRAGGIEHALVETGACCAAGHKPGQLPWTLGVTDPRQPGTRAASVQMDGRCLATSGDYTAAFTPDFLHHHIFDPATGDSPRELASATVVAPSSILADGLSTAFMVMGARKAHAAAAGMPGVDVMTINKRGVIWKSPGFPRAV